LTLEAQWKEDSPKITCNAGRESYIWNFKCGTSGLIFSDYRVNIDFSSGWWGRQKPGI